MVLCRLYERILTDRPAQGIQVRQLGLYALNALSSRGSLLESGLVAAGVDPDLPSWQGRSSEWHDTGMFQLASHSTPSYEYVCDLM